MTTKKYHCPECVKPLNPVLQSSSSMLNSEQFDAGRAGDYYCDKCKGTRASTGFRYFWEHRLRIQDCSKCGGTNTWAHPNDADDFGGPCPAPKCVGGKVTVYLTPPYPKTPELDKLKEAKVRLDTEAVGQFLDWLGEEGVSLCRAPNDIERKEIGDSFGISLKSLEEIIPIFVPAQGVGSIDSLLYRYADVDRIKVDAEKDAILKFTRDCQP